MRPQRSYPARIGTDTSHAETREDRALLPPLPPPACCRVVGARESLYVKYVAIYLSIDINGKRELQR
ncbi:hypothetical protein PUN28_017321 [Cardiocondyla obscurior]|uniref:Uncharacterized protein n=1 Tax=Cardiocondyla obscurior TaxID=286306 RepID=A0AAW2EQ25_9HYME